MKIKEVIYCKFKKKMCGGGRPNLKIFFQEEG